VKRSEIKKAVRNRYGAIAKSGGSCCNPKESCCCGANTADVISRKIGYSDEEIKAVPEGANLGLGCGNPVALASLREGETVLDLGSGAGFDCFLAAARVGKSGRVIGVDMTPEMVGKAWTNAAGGDHPNVEFRLGEIENLPVADGSVDVVISNCVINLSPDKERVFAEAYRALRPGGSLMVSDIILLREIPDDLRNSVEAYVSCIAGAETKEKYLSAIEQTGFTDIEVVDEVRFPMDAFNSDFTVADINLIYELAGAVVSIKVAAVKPVKA